ALDPHSDMFDAEDSETFKRRISRNFAGIGVRLRISPLGAEIREVIPNGPAHKSGKFARGDQLVALDGTVLTGAPLQKILGMLDGTKDSEICLGVFKHDTRTTESVTLKRDMVEMAQVRVKGRAFETPEGPIGVIFVQSFYRGVQDDVKEQIEKLGQGKPLAG